MYQIIDYNKYFPNYDFINEYPYNKKDYISEMLVKNYKTCVFNIDVNEKKEFKKVKQIDEIMKIYFLNCDFYKIVQDRLNNYVDNDIQDLNEILIDEYRNYQNNVTGFVETSRWS